MDQEVGPFLHVRGERFRRLPERGDVEPMRGLDAAFRAAPQSL